MTTVQDILRNKGSEVLKTSPEATLKEAIDSLVEHNYGSLVVVMKDQPNQIVGIITERDILRASSTKKKTFEELKVSDHMSTSLTTCSPSDSVEQVMGFMTEKRFRHMPVVENNELCGLISIGDVVKAQLSILSTEIHYLKTYIQS